MPPFPGRLNNKKAAVLVPLIWGQDIEIVVTIRASKMRQHAGEVAFPGGRPDPGDSSLLATAVREAEEEIGLEAYEPLGRLSSVPLYLSDYRMEPFVAAVPLQVFRPAPAEVEAIRFLSLGELLSRPFIDVIPYVHHGVEHYFPVLDVGQRFMYGATAFTFLEVLTVLADASGRKLPELRSGKYQWSDVRHGRVKG